MRLQWTLHGSVASRPDVHVPKHARRVPLTHSRLTGEQSLQDCCNGRLRNLGAPTPFLPLTSISLSLTVYFPGGSLMTWPSCSELRSTPGLRASTSSMKIFLGLMMSSITCASPPTPHGRTSTWPYGIETSQASTSARHAACLEAPVGLLVTSSGAGTEQARAWAVATMSCSLGAPHLAAPDGIRAVASRANAAEDVFVTRGERARRE